MERVLLQDPNAAGKPLMAGRLKEAAMVGLPGNPVSAMVCGYLFPGPHDTADVGSGSGRAAVPVCKADRTRCPEWTARTLYARNSGR